MPPTELQHLLAADGWTLRGDEAVRGRRRIIFLTPRQAPPVLRAIARSDGNRFQTIGVVVAKTTAEMNRLRSVKQAYRYPRALFMAHEEPTGTTPPSINSFTATVLTNLQVGNTPGGHYRLAFRATGLETIQPPQFFMMDVDPKPFPFGARTIGRGPVDWTPRPMLKRPFGLCRTYPPGFPTDWLKRIQLPATLTPFLYPPFADHFDLLYKVLPDGVGTRLMTELKHGDKVHMVGPLGQPFDVRQLRAAGIEEVHVVGGGVGMAPLILLVEALRFHGFRLKVFLGMATLESLRYRDELAATFGEKPRDAYIYLDDLLAAGVAPADIYLACDREAPKNIRRLPKANVFHGLVPEQYRQFRHSPLWERPSGRDRAVQIGAGKPLPQQRCNVLTFTCGPNRMMEVMTEVCRQANVPLKVLLEKRMGCGFGVCFSCVQKVRRADGTDDYVRICREGPLFDAKDILWNTDSKPNLEACGCKARC